MRAGWHRASHGERRLHMEQRGWRGAQGAVLTGHEEQLEVAEESLDPSERKKKINIKTHH